VTTDTLHTIGLNRKIIPLANGSGAMPMLGFGTLIPDPVDTRSAVRMALEAGFRHFDCAERYRNEAAVGAALAETFEKGAVRREEVFVTTKLWNNNHRPARVKSAFEASLARLGLDYVDLYLIHTPFAFQPGDEQDPRDETRAVIYDHGVTLIDTWRAMESLVDEGRCRAIGLSDVGVDILNEVYNAARVKPSVVQVESHPYLPKWGLLEWCKAQGVIFLAFASLGHGMEPRLLDDPVVIEIARRVGRTPAQVLLAWAIQRGTALLTTATTRSRIEENFGLTALPDAFVTEISERITTRVQFNAVTESGIPGFIPRQG
jgi:diketogulonate reductase-like aldo/keto reductase